MLTRSAAHRGYAPGKARARIALFAFTAACVGGMLGYALESRLRRAAEVGGTR